MKLSTKGRYGLMAMHRLAENYGEGPLPLSRIAETEGLSEAYLEQLFSLLKKKGLIRSVRGAQGGYFLAKEPQDIPIGDIIEALEGELALSCCQDKEEPCDKVDNCATKNILARLQAEMEGVLSSMSLADMGHTEP